MARYEVHDDDQGTTSMPAKAVKRAIERRLSELGGIRKVRTTLASGEAQVRVVAADGEHADELRERIEAALDYDFWIDLGLADLTYTIVIEGDHHHRRTR